MLMRVLSQRDYTARNRRGISAGKNKTLTCAYIRRNQCACVQVQQDILLDRYARRGDVKNKHAKSIIYIAHTHAKVTITRKTRIRAARLVYLGLDSCICAVYYYVLYYTECGARNYLYRENDNVLLLHKLIFFCCRRAGSSREQYASYGWVVVPSLPPIVKRLQNYNKKYMGRVCLCNAAVSPHIIFTPFFPYKRALYTGLQQ